MQISDEQFDRYAQRAQGSLDAVDDFPQSPEPSGDEWPDAMVRDFPDGEDFGSPEWRDALASCGLDPQDVI